MASFQLRCGAAAAIILAATGGLYLNTAPPQFGRCRSSTARRPLLQRAEGAERHVHARRAALVSRAVQAMGTRWWPYQLKEAGAHTLLHGAGEYIAYDTFVEAADQAYDLGHPLVLTHAWAAPLARCGRAPSRSASSGPAQLFTLRLRAAYAPMRTEGEANEPWRMQCVSRSTPSSRTRRRARTPTATRCRSRWAAASSAVCQRCLQLYHLAGFGASTGNAVWGSYSNRMPAARARRGGPAGVAVRGPAEARDGVGPYWMQRRAALAADQTNSINRLHLSDVASVGVAGRSARAPTSGRRRRSATSSKTTSTSTASAATGALGAHCTLVHDMLWLHKPRLIQLA